MRKFPQYKFKGKKYLLVDGALATKYQYENGEVSYAHLFADGTIKRYGEVIGHKEDLILCDKVTANPKISPAELWGKFIIGDGGWPGL